MPDRIESSLQIDQTCGSYIFNLGLRKAVRGKLNEWIKRGAPFLETELGLRNNCVILDMVPQFISDKNFDNFAEARD